VGGDLRGNVSARRRFSEDSLSPIKKLEGGIARRTRRVGKRVDGLALLAGRIPFGSKTTPIRRHVSLNSAPCPPFPPCPPCDAFFSSSPHRR
jgi:hypothetical protein